MTPARTWLLATVALMPAALVQPAEAAVHRFHDDHVLGTSMELVVAGADAASAVRALAAARAEIARLDKALSGWRPDSELARLNAASGPVAVSHDLYRVIERCEAVRRETGGAFSARIGEAEAVLRQAARSGERPDPARLRALAARAEGAPVRLDPAARTVDRAGVFFAVDALAKGYIVDSALAAAARAAPDAAGLMLDIGGDLRCRGRGPDGGAWRVGLAGGASPDNAAPAQVLRVADKAVATSGPGARDLPLAGQAQPHTLSPATGAPAPARTVTVVADRAADADALATAIAAAPAHEGVAFAARAGAQARIVDADGNETVTEGWDALVAPSAVKAGHARQALAKLVRTAVPARAAWPAGFQLAVDYEVPPAASGRYKPPYVAIWITDDQGRLVRTLFHLGNRPRRYLNSNYVWWRAFAAGGDVDARLAAVTRPSRQPGRYTAVWDGKDDDGVPVGQGRYTVNIEITREHGGHSLQTIPLDLGRGPAAGSAPAQDEAGPAAARYGRPSV